MSITGSERVADRIADSYEVIAGLIADACSVLVRIYMDGADEDNVTREFQTASAAESHSRLTAAMTMKIPTDDSM
jgi:hypothetical protein